ncbi:MAG: hypothetical protein V8K32_05950 [Candidatus Electrothrix gigas]
MDIVKGNAEPTEYMSPLPFGRVVPRTCLVKDFIVQAVYNVESINIVARFMGFFEKRTFFILSFFRLDAVFCIFTEKSVCFSIQ